MSSDSVQSISNIKIGEAQAAIERTPKELIPLPVAGGSVDVDENIVKGKVFA